MPDAPGTDPDGGLWTRDSGTSIAMAGPLTLIASYDRGDWFAGVRCGNGTVDTIDDPHATREEAEAAAFAAAEKISADIAAGLKRLRNA